MGMRKLRLLILLAVALMASSALAKQQVFVDAMSANMGLYPRFNMSANATLGVTDIYDKLSAGVKVGFDFRGSAFNFWLRGLLEYPVVELDEGRVLAQVMAGPYFLSGGGVSFGARAGVGYEYMPKEFGGNVSFLGFFYGRYTFGGNKVFLNLSFGPRIYLDVLK